MVDGSHVCGVGLDSSPGPPWNPESIAPKNHSLNAMKKRAKQPKIEQLQAVAIATRFLVTHEPDAEFREVWAFEREGRWWVSFGKVFPPQRGGVARRVVRHRGHPNRPT
jgi:hypothetical protein